ncbi:MAG: UbiA family prenyltransferase [Candidatus Micrarchaeia archaeon]
MQEPVSVIIADPQGRIVSFNKGAEEIFGYSAEEVVGRARVSVFYDWPAVLQEVPRVLKTARERGRWEGRVVLKRKNGGKFVGKLVVTSLWKDGELTGYCGVTREVRGEDVEGREARPTLVTQLMKWVVVLRAPFFTATIIPILLGAALAWRATGAFDWWLGALTLAGALALHAGVNTANDYWDWRTGSDEKNYDYIVPFTGGSRSIQMGMVSPRALLLLSLVLLAAGSAIGFYLAWLRGWQIVALGAVGVAAGYFYSAPPFRLAGRGIGELLVGLNFGVLMTLGAYFVQAQALAPEPLLASLPVSFLISAVLWANEIPDAGGDAASGKKTMVVRLGKEKAVVGFVALLFLAYVSLLAGIAVAALPLFAFAAVAGAFFAWKAAGEIAAHAGAYYKLEGACASTLAAHFLTGVLIVAGVLADKLI